MTSPAIKAQGTVFKVASGTGAAENITAISLGAITELTCTAHARAVGDVVAIASIVGTTQLNGFSFMVIAEETNSLFLDVDSSAYGAWSSGGTATPTTFTQILGVKSFSKSGGGASEIDTTDLDSTAKEFLTGLIDYGEFSCEISHKIGSTGQDAVRTSLTNGTTLEYQLTLTDGSIATFSALVKETPFSGAVDAAMEGTFNFKITGAIAWT